MFTKSKRNSTMSKQPSHTANTGKPQRPGPPSIVAADMRIVGDLETEGDAQIDGRIDGDLRTRTVTIGQGATINGSICGAVPDTHLRAHEIGRKRGSRHMQEKKNSKS